MDSYRVGRLTAATGLVALGTALLADNLTGTTWGDLVLRLWPVVLIGLGLEYLVRAALAERTGSGRNLHFDVGGVFLLLFIFVTVGGFSAVRQFEDGRLHLRLENLPVWNWGPGYVHSVERNAVLNVDPQATLTVQAFAGTVEVTGDSPDNQVRVRAVYQIRSRSGDPEGAAPVLETVGGATPRINATQWARPAGPGDYNLQSVRLYVQTPPGMGAEVKTDVGSVEVRGLGGNVRVETSAGTVKVREVGGNLYVRSNVGSVEIQDITGQVEARTAAGSLRAERFKGGQIETNMGTITAIDWRDGDLRVSSNSGSVRATTKYPVDRDVTIRTSVGQVELTVPPTSDAQFTLSTNLGGIEVPTQGNFTVSRNGPGGTARGTLGAGRARVDLRSDTGRAVVKTW